MKTGCMILAECALLAMLALPASGQRPVNASNPSSTLDLGKTEWFPFAAVHYGAPLRPSLEVGFFREHYFLLPSGTGPTFAGEVGRGGAMVSGGYAHNAMFGNDRIVLGGFRVSAAALRTWNGAWNAPANESFAGVQLHLPIVTLILNARVAGMYRLTSRADSKPWLMMWSGYIGW